MATKRFLVILVAALFAVLLAACELSASTPPPAVSPTTEGSMGTLEAVLGNIATQTAAAGGGEPAAPTTQPAPTQVVETPAATAVPTEEAQETEAPPPPEEEEEEEQEQEEEEPEDRDIPTVTAPRSYTLREGEFPFCIARRFDINQYELLNANNLSLNSRPPVGFTLQIPQNASGFAGDRQLWDHPDTYTVAAGDTIYEIACRYGDVSPEAIAAVNNLDEPYRLEAGQRLEIP